MQAEALAGLFDRSRREGKAWRARCPIHKGKSLTLAIYAGDERSTVHCFAGCESDDVLAAVGLKWTDCLYRQSDPKEWRAQQRARRAEEAFEYRGRIRNLIVLFANEGYSTYDRDVSVACAVARLMATEGRKAHLERLLGVHMERIIAGGLLERSSHS
jgi:putative DNA primase/helicase